MTHDYSINPFNTKVEIERKVRQLMIILCRKVRRKWSNRHLFFAKKKVFYMGRFFTVPPCLVLLVSRVVEKHEKKQQKG